VAVREDQLYLLTTRGAQNGMVLRTSAAAPALADAEVVVPEGPAVIEGIVAARDGLYLQDVDGGYGSLRVLETDEPARPVALPFEGTIEALAATPRQAGVWFVGTSWLLPRAVFRYDPVVGQVVKTGLTRPPDIDLSRFEAIRTHATARDGTRVPLSILAPRGLPRRGRAPALVDAHGAYQFVNAPDFDPRRIAFLEKGGVFAVAHVRGGGEYGRRWWKAGQKLQKPASWRDLIDCCEALVKLGFTGPGRLAIHGASAGGIAVGRALTERPDLFAAAISRVGVSNALRAEFSQSGPSSVAELGTVREADGFRGLLAMDAYHSVKDGLAYPAVLLTTGMSDPRVEPWQAAKLAARLQRASSSGRPVLLRVTFDAGHGLGSTRTQLDQEAADVYAFVLWRAAQPAPPRPGR